MSSERLARIGPVMERYIADALVRGTVTLAARRGKVVQFEAHGELDADTQLPAGRGVAILRRHGRSRLVEVMSGMSLDAFMRERIFVPRGMLDTAFLLDDTRGGRLAAQYAPGEDLGIMLQDPATEQSRWIRGPKKVFRGAGGLVSTARDYVRFSRRC